MNSARKLLPALLVLAMFLAGFPLFALLAVVSMGAQAAAACQPAGVVSTTVTTGVDAEAIDGVVGLLMQLRFGPGYPTITTEQAGNALAIARVSRGLGVPRRGLEIALATAIQESKLLNLDHGDRDSLGLFQQRPSQGWGTPAQITDPVLATRAFYGRAYHTSNPGLLDMDGWHTLPRAEAAQAVQRSAHPSAYAPWEQAARDMADLLGPDLPTRPHAATSAGANVGDCVAPEPVTLASFNILGASHTDGTPGSGLGGGENHSMPAWYVRLPNAMSLLESAGVTIAGLQEVHPPQSNALATTYADRWGMYPRDRLQNKVIWDRTAWTMTDSRLVDIPYHDGHQTPMPIVQLTSTTTGQVIWVWSIRNPVGARKHRVEALRRQHATLTSIAATGVPVVIVGDFNDSHDGPRRSHCTLTPTLANAFGGQADPCRPPKDSASIDHIYGANLSWAGARVDRTPQHDKISDHPLVVASTADPSGGSCPLTGSRAEKGLTPDALLVLRSVEARFGTHTYIGVGDRPNNPSSDHPSGRAVDVMIEGWDTPAGVDHGTRIAAWVRDQTRELGVTYLIWRKQIWSTGDTDWRPYTHPSGQSSPTLNHMDHVHVSVAGTRGTLDCGADSAAAGRVVYPVSAAYVDADRHNWHASGPNWSTWHTGTDFSAPCGVAVYAAHAGTVEVDTTQGWAGPWLVKVSTGPSSLTTWYAHMASLDVARGQKVNAGQRIGRVGAQGNATGCHLHFEVHLENGPIYGPDNTNPSTWLARHATRGQEGTGHAA
jgi:endonuclease/exonuclease/phosphatase family metal-dependent hydrolase